MAELSQHARRQLLHAELLKLVPDRPTPFAQFVKGAGFELRRSEAAGQEISADNFLTERQVKYAIQEIAPKLWPLEVVYESGNIILKNAGTAFSRRAERAGPTKSELGCALWDYLLGDWRGQTDGHRATYEICGDKQYLDSKVQILRHRNLMYFAADAGSTTLAVIRELLSAQTIPIRININPDFDFGKGNPPPDGIRTIEPVLLTNSLPIITEVMTSYRHQHTFALEVIGGSGHASKQCWTGEKASLWLNACHSLGLAASLDLVILGTSGLLIDGVNAASVACDDQEEAKLKRALLQMAEGNTHGHPGGLRVVILHAAKLLYPESRCKFAALNRGMVDLLVIDSGNGSEEQIRVNQLELLLSNGGVPMMKVNVNYSGD